ncbi:hypothetical protein [Parasphingorhabdus sp.]|uniref:hypothetical protein n=1 Tax=Parasphingorhabdus sp. TaxID=2709688 RepID=UPI003C77ABAD
MVRSSTVRLDESLGWEVAGRAETGPGAGVGAIEGVGPGAGVGSANPGGSNDSGEFCPSTGSATNSAPRLTAAKDMCLIRIRILLQIITNYWLFNRLQRLFNIHRSQIKGRTDQDCDKQN